MRAMADRGAHSIKCPAVKSTVFTCGVQTSSSFSFTYDDLHKCLYHRAKGDLVSLSGHLTNSDKHNASVFWPKSRNTAEQKGTAVTYAMKTCPSELELCSSSIPGFKYGIRTKQVIPEGTWMGPYQGTLVNPSDVTAERDTSYMWEIYENGKLLHYIDGSNEDTSSWMRFIRCARHKSEQNLFAFQYDKEIYYRAFTRIPAETELLVWYEDRYPQFMGIPLTITDIRPLDETAPSQSTAASSRLRQYADKRQRVISLCEPPVTGRVCSAVMAPSPARFRGPSFLTARDCHQSTHRRSGPVIPRFPHRVRCGQRRSSRRVILLQKANDAPDPFSIFNGERKSPA